MRNNDLFEIIIMDMHDNEDTMRDFKYIIPEDIIIEKIKALNDLEEVDEYRRTLLINASLYDRTKIIKYLLDQHVSINKADKLGYTALHAAVQQSNFEGIKLLLLHGADVHSQNKYGATPLLMCSHLRPDIMQLLLKYKSDPNLKNNYGISVFEKFVAYPDIMKILESYKKCL